MTHKIKFTKTKSSGDISLHVICSLEDLCHHLTLHRLCAHAKGGNICDSPNRTELWEGGVHHTSLWVNTVRYMFKKNKKRMTDNTWNQHLPSLSFIINLCGQAVAAWHKQSMCYVCCVRVSNGAYLELEIKTMGRFSRAVFVLVYLSFLNTMWLLGPKYTKLLQVLNLDQSGGSVQPLFQIPRMADSNSLYRICTLTETPSSILVWSCFIALPNPFYFEWAVNQPIKQPCSDQRHELSESRLHRIWDKTFLNQILIATDVIKIHLLLLSRV